MPRARRRMRRRRVGRAVVGTAVVAGTAGAVHHHQDKRYARQDAEAQEEYYDDAPQEEYVDDAPEADLSQQLQDLADLHDSGALTDEEFADAKAKLLNS